MAKPFNELTQAGKTRRLNKYEAERAERGTQSKLVRMVRPAKFKTNSDGSTLAIIRVAHYDKDKDKTDFFTATAYIKEGKSALKDFYASLKKGQLVSIEYKSQNGYNNIWNLFDRSYADNRKKKSSSNQEDNKPEAKQEKAPAPTKQNNTTSVDEVEDVDVEL